MGLNKNSLGLDDNDILEYLYTKLRNDVYGSSVLAFALSKGDSEKSKLMKECYLGLLQALNKVEVAISVKDGE